MLNAKKQLIKQLRSFLRLRKRMFLNNSKRLVKSVYLKWIIILKRIACSMVAFFSKNWKIKGEKRLVYRNIKYKKLKIIA